MIAHHANAGCYQCGGSLVWSRLRAFRNGALRAVRELLACVDCGVLVARRERWAR